MAVSEKLGSHVWKICTLHLQLWFKIGKNFHIRRRTNVEKAHAFVARRNRGCPAQSKHRTRHAPLSPCLHSYSRTPQSALENAERNREVSLSQCVLMCLYVSIPYIIDICLHLFADALLMPSCLAAMSAASWALKMGPYSGNSGGVLRCLGQLTLPLGVVVDSCRLTCDTLGAFYSTHFHPILPQKYFFFRSPTWAILCAKVVTLLVQGSWILRAETEMAHLPIRSNKMQGLESLATLMLSRSASTNGVTQNCSQIKVSSVTQLGTPRVSPRNTSATANKTPSRGHRWPLSKSETIGQPKSDQQLTASTALPRSGCDWIGSKTKC